MNVNADTHYKLLSAKARLLHIEHVLMLAGLDGAMERAIKLRMNDPNADSTAVLNAFYKR